MVELLAPAGNKESLIAAVESGANAVYLSGNEFGARAYANNFDREELAWAVHFAHLRNVHIHVTVNTIVGDGELAELENYLHFLASLPVDGVLVQDLGVAKLAHELEPTLPLHASTQMSVHSLDGVLMLQNLGFSRVVLARELSIKEIQYIVEHCDVEIEVFMHGAVCVCYSGECLMSSMIGGRSGNRGRCAQPCRLPYTLVDENGNDALGDKAGNYLLSPRDLNTLDVIPDLIRAGVTSMKIEGRMKRPEYVATVVSTYRKAIDSYYAGHYDVTQEEHDNLAQIFNRDFTTLYLKDMPGKNMMSDRRPNNRGLLIGRVLHYDWDKRLVTLKLSGKLALGDQVDFWVKVGGRVTATVNEMTNQKGQAVERAEAGDIVTFAIPSAVRDHDRAFKVYDAELMEKAGHSYKSGAPIRRIPITASVTAAIGKPLHVRLEDNAGHVAEADTEFIGEQARKRPLSRETVAKQMNRLGTSVYELTNLETTIEGEVMVPMSEINEARRQAVEKLDEMRLAEFHYPEKSDNAVALAKAKVTQKAKLMVSVDTIEKLKAAIAGGADGILFGGESYAHQVIPVKMYQEAYELCHKAKVRFDINLPRILPMKFQPSVEKMLVAAEKDFPPAAVHVHNIGELATVKRVTNLAIHADYSLISYNYEVVKFLRDHGVSEATLSPELNLAQIQEMAPRCDLPLTAIVHGRLELMVSKYCVTGSFLGGVDKGACSQPCLKGHYALKDRKEALFPLAMDQYCQMHVLNSKTLSMLPHARKLRDLGLSLRIEGKAMTPQEILRLTKDYRKAMKFDADLSEEQENWAHAEEGNDITRGHYFRGVL